MKFTLSFLLTLFIFLIPTALKADPFMLWWDQSQVVKIFDQRICPGTSAVGFIQARNGRSILKGSGESESPISFVGFPWQQAIDGTIQALVDDIVDALEQVPTFIPKEVVCAEHGIATTHGLLLPGTTEKTDCQKQDEEQTSIEFFFDKRESELKPTNLDQLKSMSELIVGPLTEQLKEQKGWSTDKDKNRRRTIDFKVGNIPFRIHVLMEYW